MKERILAFLKAENKSSAQFAEEIGVQPSGISHIVSGRNNPSLDFVLKMLDKYPYISTDWLLFGRGSMYRETGGMRSLFEQDPETDSNPIKADETKLPSPEHPELKKAGEIIGLRTDLGNHVKRIVIFYSDQTFEDYITRS